MALGVQTLFCSEPNDSGNQQASSGELTPTTLAINNAPGTVSQYLLIDIRGVLANVQVDSSEEEPQAISDIACVVPLSRTHNGVTIILTPQAKVDFYIRLFRDLAPEQNAASEGVAERSHNPSPPDGGPDVNSGSTRND